MIFTFAARAEKFSETPVSLLSAPGILTGPTCLKNRFPFLEEEYNINKTLRPRDDRRLMELLDVQSNTSAHGY